MPRPAVLLPLVFFMLFSGIGIAPVIVQNDELKNFSSHFGNHLVVRIKIQSDLCERRIDVFTAFFVRHQRTILAVFQKARKIAKTFGNPSGWLTSQKKYDKLILVRGTTSRTNKSKGIAEIGIDTMFSENRFSLRENAQNNDHLNIKT